MLSQYNHVQIVIKTPIIYFATSASKNKKKNTDEYKSSNGKKRNIQKTSRLISHFNSRAYNNGIATNPITANKIN
jgi:hypothetical protein